MPLPPKPHRPKAENVDAYIAGFDPAIQVLLEQVRVTVRHAAPMATEIISYGMPALRMHGVLVYFAAFKNHLGFYPPIRGHSALEKEASVYAGPKGNLKFPHDQALPLALIAALTRLRVAQDLEKYPGFNPNACPPRAE